MLHYFVYFLLIDIKNISLFKVDSITPTIQPLKCINPQKDNQTRLLLKLKLEIPGYSRLYLRKTNI